MGLVAILGKDWMNISVSSKAHIPSDDKHNPLDRPFSTNILLALLALLPVQCNFDFATLYIAHLITESTNLTNEAPDYKLSFKAITSAFSQLCPTIAYYY